MDAREFTEAAREYQGLMFHVSYTILRRQSDCADAVQEALLKAWNARETLRDMSLFKPWLVSILVNTCKSMLRHKRGDSVALAEDIPDAQPDHLPLYDALSRLDPALRLPIVLHYLDGLSIREISQSLRLPQSMIKNRMFRARRLLKGMLGEEETA